MPTPTDLIGTPYLWGGRDPSEGLDCWGLVRAVRPEVPDYAAADAREAARVMAEHAPDWLPADPPAPGDVLLLGTRRPHHCGILTERGVLHTTRTLGAVLEPLAAIRQRYPLIRGYRWPG